MIYPTEDIHHSKKTGNIIIMVASDGSFIWELYTFILSKAIHTTKLQVLGENEAIHTINVQQKVK